MYTTTTQGTELRNVFRLEDNPPELIEALVSFPNNVPRFVKKSDCLDFMRKHSGVPSNPEFPELRHSVSTLVSWDQIEKYLLPKLTFFNQRCSPKEFSEEIGKNNRFMHSDQWFEEQKSKGDTALTDRELTGCHLIQDYLTSRLVLPIHQRLSSYSTRNTLQYLFYHMKCGILVSIRDNKLVVFCPFVNKDYENNWHDVLDIDLKGGVLESYYLKKSQTYREENIILNKAKWWANGNIICNEQDEQMWGDHFLLPLRDMLSETCNQREVPDCDFFINKRDYPQLKFNTARKTAVEPYGFIYDCDDKIPERDVDLTRHNYPTLTPILSFYTSDRFADIPFPPSEDWEAATGEVFPPSMTWEPSAPKAEENLPKIRDLFTAENLKNFDKAWSEKRNVAFFRGTATGGGVTADTNQRLNVAVMSALWASDPKLAGYLDAKIVGWNMRDKKIAGQKMTYINKSKFPFEVTRANFTPIYEQSSYKYLLYIEGHCAACRYGFMMVLGSVILKVESRCVADQLWYFPLLEPYYDHVPVKADLSDLAEQIEWCRSHDEECREIANRARMIHDRFLAKEGILDYMQMTLSEISKRWVRPLDCFRDSSSARAPPYDVASDNRNHCLEVMGEAILCSTCEEKHAVFAKNLQDQQVLAAATTGKRDLKAGRDKMKIREQKKRKASGAAGPGAGAD